MLCNDFSNPNFRPDAPEEALLRKKHAENKLATTSMSCVLSVRLREGYTVRNVAITKGNVYWLPIK